MFKLNKKLSLGVACALLLVGACANHDKKPGDYFYAQPGKPVSIEQADGAISPIGSNPLQIPKAAAPLGEYNVKLKEPPQVVEIPK